ncbi:MAG: Translation initiation factor 1A [Candidatus Heimdallarchaeota archaeon LC_2]|nr:MAG: Translation initiation factor 1A [Candidatus Heimdallarchaeota archaeon LC_2]
MGQVIQNLGGRLLLVRCMDSKTRQVSIPGKYRRRMWVRLGDVIILIPQYGMKEDEKGMLEFRYSKNEAKLLYERELIPEEYLMI